MTLRVARHTDRLDKMPPFYCGILGLEILGTFQDHAGYDGIFIGTPGMAWHLEFTVSNERPKHVPDADDLLVFYLPDDAAFTAMNTRFAQAGIAAVPPANPYWQENGITYPDPDGFRIVLAVKR